METNRKSNQKVKTKKMSNQVNEGNLKSAEQNKTNPADDDAGQC